MEIARPARLEDRQLDEIRRLEERLGVVLVGYERLPQYRQLSPGELERLRSIERETGSVLVAYEAPARVTRPGARRRPSPASITLLTHRRQHHPHMPTATGTPTVSVVLPTYNRAHLLPRAIESVLAQTYTDFELIVVDDGSGDDTPAVMARYDDPRVRYVRYEPNQGANHARNVGIREARGPFISFQDSDDDWFPEKLAKNMAAFETAAPEVGVVYSGYWKYVDASENRIYIPLPWVKRRDGWIHEELLRNNFVTTQAAVVRRECFDRSGYWLEGLPGKQEWDSSSGSRATTSSGTSTSRS